jgi:HEAT repeat protein
LGATEPATIQRLALLLGDGDDDVRTAAMHVLLDVAAASPNHASRVVEAVSTRLVASPNPDERTSAAHFLGAVGAGGGRRTGRLVDALADPHPRVRAAAAASLGKVADGSTAQALRRTAEADSSEDVRAEAVEAVTLVDPEGDESFATVRRALRDPSPVVRERAVFAVAALCGGATSRLDRAMPDLIGALSDSRPAVRVAAAQSLATLGGRATNALSALRGLLDDESLFVRARALAALDAIAGAPRERPIPRSR